MPEHRLPDPDPVRRPHELLPLDAPAPETDACPGWLLRLPEVNEAFEAFRWWDKGQLADFHRGQPASPWLQLYVDTVGGALADLDVARERKREEERREAEAAAERSRRR